MHSTTEHGYTIQCECAEELSLVNFKTIFTWAMWRCICSYLPLYHDFIFSFVAALFLAARLERVNRGTQFIISSVKLWPIPVAVKSQSTFIWYSCCYQLPVRIWQAPRLLCATSETPGFTKQEGLTLVTCQKKMTFSPFEKGKNTLGEAKEGNGW